MNAYMCVCVCEDIPIYTHIDAYSHTHIHTHTCICTQHPPRLLESPPGAPALAAGIVSPAEPIVGDLFCWCSAIFGPKHVM
jgi:hypothetical protein